MRGSLGSNTSKCSAPMKVNVKSEFREQLMGQICQSLQLADDSGQGHLTRLGRNETPKTKGRTSVERKGLSAELGYVRPELIKRLVSTAASAEYFIAVTKGVSQIALKCCVLAYLSASDHAEIKAAAAHTCKLLSSMHVSRKLNMCSMINSS